MPEEGPAQKPHASDNRKPLNCMTQEFSKSGAHKQMILEQRQPMDIQTSTWLTLKEPLGISALNRARSQNGRVREPLRTTSFRALIYYRSNSLLERRLGGLTPVTDHPKIL
jgi:hypothetical protein